MKLKTWKSPQKQITQRLLSRLARKVKAGRAVAPKDIRAEWVHMTDDGEIKRLS